MMPGHGACLVTRLKMEHVTHKSANDRCRGLLLLLVGLAVSLCLGLLSARIAVADELPGAISDRQSSVRRLEDARAQAAAQQTALAAQLSAHAAVIEQLKASGSSD